MADHWLDVYEAATAEPGGAADRCLAASLDQTVALQNVVAGADLRVQVDNAAFAAAHPYSYLRDSFCASGYVRREHAGDVSTVILFMNGHGVFVGPRSAEQIFLVMHTVRMQLEQEVGPARIDAFRVVNVVFSTSACDERGCPLSIDIDGIAAANPAIAESSPRRFPGLQYKDRKYNVLVRIFRGGKIVLMGFMNSRQARGVLRRVARLIRGFVHRQPPAKKAGSKKK